MNRDMEQTKKSVFETLNAVDCNGHTEKKNGLTYLSWAWAWAEVKKRYPGAYFTIYENPDGWPYWTDGRTCWVKTGVSIEGLEHTEYLPIMDHRNNSIPYERLTSMDVNKSIQRSLTKACARHGLGLYIYAGEDLPEASAEGTEKPADEAKPARTRKPSAKAEKAAQATVSATGKKVITDDNIKQVVAWTCKAPEGPQRDARIETARTAYEWPGGLFEAYLTMVAFSE